MVAERLLENFVAEKGILIVRLYSSVVNHLGKYTLHDSSIYTVPATVLVQLLSMAARADAD